jgi:hypothetical protein
VSIGPEASAEASLDAVVETIRRAAFNEPEAMVLVRNEAAML